MSGDPEPFFAWRLRQPGAPLALMAMHRIDARRGKIEVGVYRDEIGPTRVMRAVKAAEARLLAEQPAALAGAAAKPDARRFARPPWRANFRHTCGQSLAAVPQRTARERPS